MVLYPSIVQGSYMFSGQSSDKGVLSNFLQSPKRSTFPLERWANGEWTVNARWTNTEWTMSERWMQVGERYVNAERWANAERERSPIASAMWTVNARWTNDKRFIRKVSEIFLALHWTPNLVRIYMYIWVIELCNFV